jgi:putative transcriptional regulator
MEFITGKALVASPYLTERNFLRSVVFILRHDDEGAFGLILNRPTAVTVGELMERFLGQPFENTEPIYNGGPVEGPLLALHEIADIAEPDEFEICAEMGLYVASDQATLVDLWQRSDGKYRCFDGYSGWGAGQLEDELKAGGWLVWDAPRASVFADPETLWKQAVQQIGREILSVQIDASRIPIDPAAN